MKSAFWNIVFGLFFLALVAKGSYILYTMNVLPVSISILDLVLVVLAVFRLVRLVSYDIITAFIRDWLNTFPHDSFFGTMGALVRCPWCTGLWFSFFVSFFYFATPFAWFVIFILAIAGIASLFQLLGNLIGWSAELKKRTVLGSEGKSNSTCG